MVNSLNDARSSSLRLGGAPAARGLGGGLVGAELGAMSLRLLSRDLAVLVTTEVGQ